ncbi:MAG: glycerol-3-phosphate dehydrogenase/oxidase [bacterium]
MRIVYPDKVKPVRFSAQTRQRVIERLQDEVYDFCVIGGGITGAGIAWESSQRGLKTLLIDKSDFAAGTSSKSSKLVHGGFRYLKQYEFGLVRAALLERYRLLRLAPHLVGKLPIIFPIYEDSEDGYWKIKAGMILYDLLCGFKRIGKHQMHSGRALEELVPDLRQEGLVGGAQFFDAKADDSRLVLATLQSAVLAGCDALNYFSAIGFDMNNGRAEALRARDEINGMECVVRAKSFINASGAWSDSIRRLGDNRTTPRIRSTKGIHAVVKHSRLPLDYAVMLISTLDSRPLFAVPWGDFVLLGTTDTDFSGSLELVYATTQDVGYLLNSFNYVFPRSNLRDSDIISTYAGVRPLVIQEGRSSSEVSREHAMFESPGNVFNIIGGKLTTYRLMASELISFVSRSRGLRLSPKPATDDLPLYGSEVANFESYAAGIETKMQDEFKIPPDVARYLLSAYGCHVETLFKFLRNSSNNKQRIVPGLPFIWAQLPYAIEHEMTISLDDFLIRRTHLFSLDLNQGREVVVEIASRMGQILNWSEDDKRQHIQKYLTKVELAQRFRQGIHETKD